MTQYEFQQTVNTGWLLCGRRDFRARRFQQMSVFNSGGTRGFARPTAKATIDVRAKRIRRVRQAALLDRAHEIDATARTVILVRRHNVRGTGFQTEAAMNAGENLFLFAGQDC